MNKELLEAMEVLEKEKNIVYNRIYRLKGKIDSSEAENKAEFLDFLSK